ncbi:MAG: HD domain-containing protein [Bacteroidales bacterium]|nr:HD domain-containing protein [Bacteroidales bacterium]MCM1416479.1 HD domain-containing protein [bacterium]MCM1424575.1 HD domain-containing protein [bacterium]
MMELKGMQERRQERLRRLYERHKKICALLREHGEDILQSDNFKKTRAHIQHGTMTVHRHCLDVARYSLLLNKKLGIGCNKRDLIRGALLHDYFLYDWHDKAYLAHRKRLHGFHHPMTALKNAEQEYELNDIQREIIRKHMWPLSVIPPTCREAWVVTAADKYCSFLETIGVHKGHGARREERTQAS